MLIIKNKSMLVVIVTMSSGFARTFRLNIALILSTLFELCCRVSKQAARERINRKGREKLIISFSSTESQKTLQADR